MQAKSNANSANCLNQGREYTVYTLYKDKHGALPEGRLCFIWAPMDMLNTAFVGVTMRNKISLSSFISQRK